jgi:tripartite-type tricarboxylate transporter receptor subunit TctC
MLGLIAYSAMAAAAALSLVRPVAADPISDFYQGKTVTIVLGVGDGTHYDMVGRLVARHLRKYIPGNPTIITQAMPGASHQRATEFSFNRAPRDGTSMLVVQPVIVLNKAMNPSLPYDLGEFTWIGRVHPLEVVGVAWHTAPARSFRDAQQKDLVFGGNAPTGPASMIPWALNKLAGTRIRITRGYQSQAANFLAMERGEVDGIGNVTLSEVQQKFGDKAVLLWTNALTRIAKIPDVPSLVELVAEHDRPVMQALAGVADVGLTVMAPPQIPHDRVDALQAAFDRMTADREYREELERLHYDSGPLTGADLARLVKDNFNLSADVLERLRAATAPQ